MITHPNAAELARAVAHWLDELRPQLDQRNAYLARVAANALAIVEREVAQREAGESATAARLSQLLGKAGDYDSLTRELCECLRSGRMDIATPGLLALLRDDTLAKLAVDQPSYRHERLG
jgi:hypothetical protein